MYWLLKFLILTYIHYAATDLMMKNADNYGPYYVEWEHYDSCRGPKLVNLTDYTTTLVKSENNIYRGILNATFLEQARFDEIKMAVYAIKDGTKTLLWNYIVNKPCQHYMLGALLNYNLGGTNCVAKKGHYYMDMNLTELMMKHIGNNFFYGDYFFKVLVLSKKGNVFCLIFDPKFKKKVKN